MKTPALKIPLFVQFVAARAVRPRITLPAIPRHPMCLADRETRARQRAQELAVWQASGGDYLHAPLAE